MTKKQLIKLYELLCLAEAELNAKCEKSMIGYMQNLVERQSILTLKETINKTLKMVNLKKIKLKCLTEEEKKKYYKPIFKKINP